MTFARIRAWFTAVLGPVDPWDYDVMNEDHRYLTDHDDECEICGHGWAVHAEFDDRPRPPR